ncbi:unnamed protein product [Periconia digitata]|uniref:Reducing type I polyketide synthase n=1 Tax=Periconia digitata TaxID=1303443 RepID=A0A9W4US04_9PLEO|nr:unnamed protein product [Periconia digitata]
MTVADKVPMSHKTAANGHANGDNQSQPTSNGEKHESQKVPVEAHLEPLAIIGMAFQFPDGADTEDSFWEMLVQNRCASREYPKERLNIGAFYSTDRNKPGAIHTKNAHFLRDDIRNFDPAFFSISPADARAMDPCQRTLMETTYHALENSGLSLSDVSGSKTSVHVGCFSSDHMTTAFRDLEQMQRYSATGISSAMLSNRLSWFFNLHGPSLTIDTACSSGMVALDLACEGLWSGQTSMAIVSASNLNLTPELNVSLSNMGFLSPDGRCFSFDHRANGYARGEGVVTLIIKPLSKAIESGNQIRALIRSVGSNQDGRTAGGITQPSKTMQAELIRETYRRAGADLDMSKTRYFEAHGTGTTIGDPIEAEAIGECSREHFTDDHPLFVGAVKSNIGHTEGTSGLAGIVKAVLALEKGIIPPNTNFERLNPDIDAEFYRLAFPQECIDWPAVSGGVRRASVNSFGFGGANAHVVLDDVRSYLQAHRLSGNHRTVAPKLIDTDQHKNGHKISKAALDVQSVFVPQLLIFSAFDKGGIERQTQAHSTYLNRFGGCYPPNFFSDYAFTLAKHRTRHTWNSFCVVESSRDVENIGKLLEHGPATGTSLLNTGFVFTGQGAQWHGMGHELLSNPIFRQSIDGSQRYLTDLGCKWSVRTLLTDDKFAHLINEAQYSQVVTTVVQLALVDLTSSLGITPSVVVGHSSGEIAAAYTAGLISHKSAIKISYYRGLLASELQRSQDEPYAMAAVGLSAEEVEHELHVLWTEGTPVVISCINSPSTVTVSGPDTELDVLISHLRSKDLFCRKLRVSLGYHSPQMNAISSRYLEVLGDLDPGSPQETPRPPMVSSVTGDLVDSDIVCNGQYWVRNMVSVVNFLAAIQRCSQFSRKTTVLDRFGSKNAKELAVDGWLEIGPHSALQGPIREILKSLPGIKEIRYTSTLVRNQSAVRTLLAAAGYLHCHNFPVIISNATSLGMDKESIECRRMLDISSYQFNHDIIYWEESPMNVHLRLRSRGPHELLGTRVGAPNPFEAEWRFIIREDSMPWIREHKVNGTILYPAAGMLVMAIEAGRQLSSKTPLVAIQLEDVDVPAPIVISTTGEQTEVRLHISSASEDTEIHNFRIFSCKQGIHRETVCSGKIRQIFQRSESEIDNGRENRESAERLALEYDTIRGSCHQTIDETKLYNTFDKDLGLQYGPSFQTLRRVCSDNAGHAIAQLAEYESAIASSHVIHPTQLDGMFQLCYPAAPNKDESSTMVPTHFGRIWVSIPGSSHPSDWHPEMTVCATATSSLRQKKTFNIKAVNHSTMHLNIEVDELVLSVIAASPAKVKTLEDSNYLCAHMKWRADLDVLDKEEIQEFCEEVRPAKQAPEQRFQDMTRLCLHYGEQALRDVTEEEVVPSMKRYATWLRKTLNQRSTDKMMNPDDVQRLYMSLLPSTRVELQTIVGQNLARLLRGEVDPLELFFTDESKMTKFYAEAMEDSTSQLPLSRFLDSLTHKTPNLSFLEVGAGTGGSTTAIMKTIGDSATGPAFEHYTYTDISPSFFEQAQERFAALDSRMTYRMLDIERDPASQGYELGAYDIVIADNVLHATKDISKALIHVHKLLRPGGKLILRELSSPEGLLTGYLFGLLPGWWLATEETRQLSPTMSVSSWDNSLRKSGFSGTDLILPDYPGSECNQVTFMVSTAIESSAALSNGLGSTSMFPIFIVDSLSSSQACLALSVAQFLDGDQARPNMMTLVEAAALATRTGYSHDFVFLNETESPLLPAVEHTVFDAIKDLLASARSILWVKKGGAGKLAPDFATSDGLCRVSRNENSRVALVTVALEVTSPSNARHIANIFRKLHWHIDANDSIVESEYSVINGRPHINRVRRAKYLDEHVFMRTERPLIHRQANGQKLDIDIRVPGLLDTIEYAQAQNESPVLGATEIEIEVKALGLNYKDILLLIGLGKSDNLGSEYAGIVRATGSSVAGIKPGDRTT